jgi:hypothetical protein
MNEHFLLDGIREGFHISSISSMDQICMVEAPNHPSALKYSDLVNKELVDQIVLSHCVKASEPPYVVSPIAAILKENADDVRIIHDGSRPTGDAMNDYSDLHPVHSQTLE